MPGMMTVSVDWTAIEKARRTVKAKGGDFQPSLFTMFAYAVAKATAEHPVMRSTLVGDSVVRTYDHINLGIAVALPGDELVLAVVPQADTLDWPTFAATMSERIRSARHGDRPSRPKRDTQYHEHGRPRDPGRHGGRRAAGNRDGLPWRSPLGRLERPQQPRFQRQSNVGITIDHRLINGVGGADFLNKIRHCVENIDGLVGT